ncbi:MAG: hydroxyacylglutathione hydrolase [Limnothrix sp.]
MDIVRLPAFNDNYLFVLRAEGATEVVVVDPGDGKVILDYLRRQGLTLRTILITHHHYDHVGGNRLLLSRFPNAAVYASAYDQAQGRIPGQTHALNDGDRLTICGRTAEILFVPGHTQGHIVYYFPPAQPESPGDLFCGDTLFLGGCGRLLEGNPQQMRRSLARIRSLPDNTKIWCAHEYTLTNLRFALGVDPENIALNRRFDQVKLQRQRHEATVPGLLSLEKEINPFLRWDDPEIQKQMQHREADRVFTKLRGKRDLF